MKVRPAKFSDSAEIVEIWNPYIKKTFVTFNASEKTQEEVCELIKDRRDHGHEFWVASQDDKIIGFCSEGDVIRAMADGSSLFTPAIKLANISFKYLLSKDISIASEIMHRYNITLLPVLGQDMTLIDVILLRDIFEG